MLSEELNTLITRTSAGTPMGELMRRYWIPALLSEEIPEPDCPPVQVRMLGEALVAFRDTDGRIGLLDEHCAHRGTSLFYGRNEGCGLRCIYHGWKYDVEGNVLETPAEPADSEYRSKLHQAAYPCIESGGMVFTYMGPPALKPLFPAYEWTQLPVEQTYVTKCLLECNYLQGLEGECDSAHLSFLHRQMSGDGVQSYALQDMAPAYEIEETDFGLRLVALRNVEGGKTYVRVSSFTLPLSCWILARHREQHFFVPIDDQHAWRYDFGFLRDRPAGAAERSRRGQIGDGFVRVRNQRNHYLQDRQVQRTSDYTGIDDFINEDACATETMGPIYNRSREHLGVSDKAIIAVRQRLVDAARALERGETPPHLVYRAEQNHFAHVDTFGEVIPAGATWRECFPHLTRTAETPMAAAGD